MANNYTVSTFTATETIGDSILAQPSNMITSGTLTITPDPGFVISASDFSVTNIAELTDPANSNYAHVYSVIFTNTGTASQPGNLVTATVTFANTLILTSDTTIGLNISGTASQLVEETVNVNIPIIIDTNTDTNVTNTVVEYTDYTISEASDEGVETITVVGEAVANVSQQIATLTVAADEGFCFPSQPYLTNVNIPDGVITLAVASFVQSSPITSYTFNVMFRSDVDIKANSGSKVLLNYETAALSTATTTREVKHITYGDSQVSGSGETRVITIHGDPGAEFDLTVTRF